jgi:hypothetical protein
VKLPFGRELRWVRPTGWKRVRFFLWVVLLLLIAGAIEQHYFGF